MKKSAAKRVTERRSKKAPKSGSSEPAEKTRAGSPEPAQTELCHHCSKDLRTEERALFVEEEVGRVFCSESCITDYFAPEIEKLEKEYYQLTSQGDLSSSERRSYAHLRWITLQEPEEVWRERTLSGDYRHVLISEFQPTQKQSVWCVCICLFLRGEPSFLYLSFTTKNPDVVDRYRKGERVRRSAAQAQPVPGAQQPMERALEHAADDEDAGAESAEVDSGELDPDATHRGGQIVDGLAEDWTAAETYQAQLNQERRGDDIPPEEYSLYEACLDETLKEPDEVWSVMMGEGEQETRLYHFIKSYPDEKPLTWYIVVARELDDEEQIELLDAFPTRDAALVERYRAGEQEIGAEDLGKGSSQRIVH